MYPPLPDSTVESNEDALPRELEVTYSGRDGHIYIAEGDGRRTQRLTWSIEDFSTLPGMPAMPGVCGNLEDSLVFTNPVSSADGKRIAVFGLLPTLFDNRELYPWEPWIGDEHSDSEWEVVQAPSDGATNDDEANDVIGQGMVLVVYGDQDTDEDEIGVDSIEETVEDDDGLPSYWPGSKVYVMHRDGVRVWEPWAEDEGTPVHLEWAPDDEHLMVLHQAGDLMHLDLISYEGDGEDVRIASGAPLFWAWQPGGRRLAVRTDHPEDSNALLHFCDPLDHMESQLIGPAGSFYRPAWHPEGKAMVYGRRDDREDVLALVDAEGKPLRDLFHYSGRVAFDWDPRGSQLAIAQAPEGHGPFQALRLLELDGASRTLWRGTFICFKWLHDGSGFLICSSDLEKGHLQWLLINQDGSSRPVGKPFVPTRETAVSLHFFEQVSTGQPFLSADDRFVTYAGFSIESEGAEMEASEAPVNFEGTAEQSRILISPLNSSTSIAVGEGRYGCFPAR